MGTADRAMGRAFGEERKAHFEELRRRFDQRFGPERARRICETSRNLGIFPNLVINDIMAVTVRTFFPGVARLHGS